MSTQYYEVYNAWFFLVSTTESLLPIHSYWFMHRSWFDLFTFSLHSFVRQLKKWQFQFHSKAIHMRINSGGMRLQPESSRLMGKNIDKTYTSHVLKSSCNTHVLVITTMFCVSVTSSFFHDSNGRKEICQTKFVHPSQYVNHAFIRATWCYFVPNYYFPWYSFDEILWFLHENHHRYRHVMNIAQQSEVFIHWESNVLCKWLWSIEYINNLMHWTLYYIVPGSWFRSQSKDHKNQFLDPIFDFRYTFRKRIKILLETSLFLLVF